MDFKKRYKDYSPKVQEWMNTLITDMEREMGDIPESYTLQLDMLADTCDVLNTATEDLRTNGLIVEGRKGERVKNPSCAIWNSAQLSISKLLAGLVMTRSTKARLKIEDDLESSPIDEYL